MSRVILLNGVGSAGKTSIAQALQQLSSTPLVHVQMDAFLEMLPPRSFDMPEGLSFRTLEIEGPPQVEVTSGPVARRLFAGMRRAIAALADEGNDLVVDDVLLSGDAETYRRLLSAHDLRLVGVFAPLEVLEARERARGDRMIGLARWQFDRVHGQIAYDLTLDTSRSTPEACAAAIVEAFGL